MEPHLNDDQIEELLQPALASSEESTFVRGVQEDARKHLQICESCQARVREQSQTMGRLALIKSIDPEAPGPECPPDDVWLEVLAGLATEDSENHLSHAANCDHCGPFLLQAAADLATELTPEEISKISALTFATPTWQ